MEGKGTEVQRRHARAGGFARVIALKIGESQILSFPNQLAGSGIEDPRMRIDGMSGPPSKMAAHCQRVRVIGPCNAGCPPLHDRVMPTMASGNYGRRRAWRELPRKSA
jgi:hypothetical protein